MKTHVKQSSKVKWLLAFLLAAVFALSLSAITGAFRSRTVSAQDGTEGNPYLIDLSQPLLGQEVAGAITTSGIQLRLQGNHHFHITGSTTSNTLIVMAAANVFITFEDVTIDLSAYNALAETPAFMLGLGATDTAQATVNLVGVNTFNGGGITANATGALDGIRLNSSSVLTIQGSGTLNATGKDHGSGISLSRAWATSAAVLNINGGTVNATGGANGGAGIAVTGMGGHTLNINGGTVTARGGGGGAGIGGWIHSGTTADNYAMANAGNININGGYVSAARAANTAPSTTNFRAADIGGAASASATHGHGGTVTITNGVVDGYTTNAGASSTPLQEKGFAIIGGRSRPSQTDANILPGTLTITGGHAVVLQVSGTGTGVPLFSRPVPVNAEGAELAEVRVSFPATVSVGETLTSFSVQGYPYPAENLTLTTIVVLTPRMIQVWLPKSSTYPLITATTQDKFFRAQNTVIGNVASFIVNITEITAQQFYQAAVDQAVSLIDWDAIKNANESQDNVLSALTLPATIGDGVEISWTSTDAAINQSTGAVTRQAFSYPDTTSLTVTLTASFSKGGATGSKEFTVTVGQLDPTDGQAITATRDWLVAEGWDLIKGGNNMAVTNNGYNITSDLVLPAQGLFGTTITWTWVKQSDDTPDTGYIDVSVSGVGTIVRPPFSGERDVTGRLQARVAKGSASALQVLIPSTQVIRILRAEPTQAEQDAIDVAAAKNLLNWNAIRSGNSAEDNILSNLNLVNTIGTAGVSVTWAWAHTGGDAAGSVSNAGVVTRPPFANGSDTTGTLTATLTKGAATETATFTVTLKMLDATQADLDKAAADAVILLISQLPASPVEGDLAQVQAARTAYDLLNTQARAMVINYAVLQAAESALAGVLMAQEVIAINLMITALNSNTTSAALSTAVDAVDTRISEWTGDVALAGVNTAELEIQRARIATLAASEAEVTAINALIAALSEFETSATLSDAIDAIDTRLNEWTGDALVGVDHAALSTQRARITTLSNAEVTYVRGLINNLPDENDVEESDAAAIAYARSAYNALSGAQQDGLVDVYDKLTDAEVALAALLPAEVLAVIARISEIGTVTLDSGSDIQAARNAYNALSEEDKARVANFEDLTAAEAALTALQNAAAAEVVQTQIAALPAAASLTLANAAAVAAARTAYNALSAAQKPLVTNLAVLEAAEAKITELQNAAAAAEAAAAVQAQIAALPATASFTLANAAAVAAARSAYNALTSAQKSLVTNLEVLEAAEAKIAELQKQEDEKGGDDDNGKRKPCGGGTLSANGGIGFGGGLLVLGLFGILLAVLKQKSQKYNKSKN
ncbi:MAG: hypothetical protein FWH03_01315 [Firmicutes bacterium]|nr:hypothetical protein [Bacillota bacterium]